MKKHLCLLACVLLAAPVFLYSQTAAAIEELLYTNAVSKQQAAWLVLEAADISGPAGIYSPAQAFLHAVEQQWFPAGARANDRVRLDQVSLLVMRSFNIRGGIFFRLTGSPHYAFRELTARGIIAGITFPRMTVSGYELLFIVNRVLAFAEADLL